MDTTPSLRSILCAVDFSEPSRQALRWAIAIANEWSSRLTVLTAVDPLLAEAARARFALDLVTTDVDPALRHFVDATANGASAKRARPELIAQIGEAAAVVLSEAARLQADLIVIGTHGLSGLKKLMLGSTAERVLRKATVPVLAIPPAALPATVSDTGGPLLAVRAVLAASDFSRPATRALQYAAAIARRLNARLFLTHVVSPLNVSSEFQRYVEGIDEHATARARTMLEAQGCDVLGPQPVETLVELGRPADRIASIGRDRGAGLIVMGLASEQGAHAGRPGAIAYRVLCQSHVPVLVVPPQTPATRTG
jgi:nucleotide-binding universal stress UspA family protein